MPAIRLLDTEHQTELAYLHEQLIEGEPVQDKSWRYAEEYLMVKKERLQSVEAID